MKIMKDISQSNITLTFFGQAAQAQLARTVYNQHQRQIQVW